MADRRILLMHVTTSSGHHRASLAIARALSRLDPSCQVINVDAFDYTSRFVRWGIMRSYMSMIQNHPDVWEYLYDNPAVHKHISRIRTLLHRYHENKLRRLLESVQPHAIACTQAFPCGIVADFKRRNRGLDVSLVGVLTDFAPHLYWIHDEVDLYVVPAKELKDRFELLNVAGHRIRIHGIPVEPCFMDPVDRDRAYERFGLSTDKHVIMIMGGGGGFGPLKELIVSLDRCKSPCQFVVLAGTNRLLLDWINQQSFSHKIVATGYIDCISELMEISSLLVTKPGGLTSAEALAKKLPLVIVSPIPGQEICNARYLISNGAALRLWSTDRAAELLDSLLADPEQLLQMREKQKSISRPDSAIQTARMLLELADKSVFKK